MRFKIWLFALLLLGPNAVSAQSYDKEYGVAFAWEVKQVDEFIERFNNDDSSFINEYLKTKGSATSPTREKMLKSLFNAKGTNWNYEEITAFIKQVSRVDSPQYLDFDQANWYANVQCQILHHGKPEKATLKLNVLTLPDGSSKWVISDVEFPGASMGTAGVDKDAPRVQLPRPTNAKVSLNPMSHAIDFMNIDLVTKKPENIENFLVGPPERSRNLDLFIDACLKNQLKIIRATAISYTFLQIKGWRIEVKQYHRQSLNSGWLISKLVKLS